MSYNEAWRSICIDATAAIVSPVMQRKLFTIGPRKQYNPCGLTYNDVVRNLLRLSKTSKSANSVVNGGKPWVVSDTSFPAGSEFMSDYKGKTYFGIAKDGKLELSNGHTFSTPSAAAVSVTGSNVNGWRFWKCRLPGASH
jgi:hypothetical protein